MQDKADIHCPCCRWRPGPEDRWTCVPSCGTVWNTFWTRGVCPGCGVKWPHTQCLACERFSPHEAWYHSPPEADGEPAQATETDDRRVPEKAVSDACTALAARGGPSR